MFSALVRAALVSLLALSSTLVQEVASASPALQQKGLMGTAWKWTGTLMNDGSRTVVQDPNRYLVTFLDGERLAIRADCNRVLGTYTTKGNQLTITPGPSTLAACPPDSLSTVFLEQLRNVRSYFFKGASLVLEIKFDSGSMTFIASGTGLAGTSWNVVNYNNGKQAVVTLLAKSEIYLNFGTDARVSGNAGCNQYTGGYQSSGDRLTVSTLATTFKLCHTPVGVMKQEAQYLAALSKAARFEIAGDTLTIRDAAGAMQVIASAKQSSGAR
jgi:heat shock protein HslJ